MSYIDKYLLFLRRTIVTFAQKVSNCRAITA